ncbi:hypothetical protein [Helicobacter acinonychis]|uniref:hypothetical protein n=1 Tax=Helicobacter acinonychis TaxID=212 RepID=UPI00059FEB7A|nr:hypothetical protein [Helicobacter acinonychis]
MKEFLIACEIEVVTPPSIFARWKVRVCTFKREAVWELDPLGNKLSIVLIFRPIKLALSVYSSIYLVSILFNPSDDSSICMILVVTANASSLECLILPHAKNRVLFETIRVE